MYKNHKGIIIAILILAIGGGALYYNRTQATKIDQEKERVSAHVREIAAGKISEKDFAPGADAPQFEKVWQELKTFSIVRVKMWNTDYTIVWSNLPELIGQKFPDNTELKEAYEGEIELEVLKGKTENLAERSYTNAKEMYVPLINEKGTVYGVVELYYTDSSTIR